MKFRESMNSTQTAPAISRAEFLHRSAKSVAGAFMLATFPRSVKTHTATTTSKTVADGASPYDLRDFVNWIIRDFEPSVRLPGPAGHYARAAGSAKLDLYGTDDMACILYSIGRLRPSEKERAEWAEAFQSFQNADTGFLLEKEPTHPPLHNTAFTLAAMQLLNLTPKYPVKMAGEFSDPRAYLSRLDWKKSVYPDSLKGAGMGSIFALSPDLGTPRWFAEYFAACDSLLDPKNGLMGQDKPASGDFDGVGGTFHYCFLYNYFNRRMPYPERRIDSILGLQQTDGYLHPTNRLWLTLDAMYLLTRTVRFCPYRTEDARKAVRRIMDSVMVEVFSPEGRKKTFTGQLPVHTLTCAISIAAEVQQFLGADQVITEWPLRLVLDRRPFI